MKLIIILLLATNLFAITLSKEQQKISDYIFKTGQKYKTNDGTTISESLRSIALGESSFGLNMYGDKYKDGTEKPVVKMSLGVFQVKVDTAKYIIRKDNLKHHFWLLKKDSFIASKLLSDLEFNTEMAARYFIINYNTALKRGYWSPLLKAISRHNGGWNNITYYRKVMRNMRKLK